jgi:hypothetical protein
VRIGPARRTERSLVGTIRSHHQDCCSPWLCATRSKLLMPLSPIMFSCPLTLSLALSVYKHHPRPGDGKYAREPPPSPTPPSTTLTVLQYQQPFYFITLDAVEASPLPTPRREREKNLRRVCACRPCRALHTCWGCASCGLVGRVGPLLGLQSNATPAQRRVFRDTWPAVCDNHMLPYHSMLP